MRLASTIAALGLWLFGAILASALAAPPQRLFVEDELRGSRLFDMTRSPDVVVAVGDGGAIVWSDDEGHTWQVERPHKDCDGCPVEAPDFYQVHWSGEVFTALAEAGIASSQDGRQWSFFSPQVSSIERVEFYDVASAGAWRVVIGASRHYRGERLVLFFSGDGKSWTDRSDALPTLMAGDYWVDAHHDGDRWVLVSSYGQISWSRDLEDWKTLSIGGNGRVSWSEAFKSRWAMQWFDTDENSGRLGLLRPPEDGAQELMIDWLEMPRAFDDESPLFVTASHVVVQNQELVSWHDGERWASIEKDEATDWLWAEVDPSPVIFEVDRVNRLVNRVSGNFPDLKWEPVSVLPLAPRPPTDNGSQRFLRRSQIAGIEGADFLDAVSVKDGAVLLGRDGFLLRGDLRGASAHYPLGGRSITELHSSGAQLLAVAPATGPNGEDRMVLGLSEDGRQWTWRDSTLPFQPGSIHWDGSGWVVHHYNGLFRFHQGRIEPLLERPWDLWKVGSTWVKTGEYGGKVWRSRVWPPKWEGPFVSDTYPYGTNQIIRFHDVWIAVGEGIAWSDDEGARWQSGITGAAENDDPWFDAVRAADGVAIAVGDDGRILRSTDGRHWVQAELLGDGRVDSFEGLLHENGRWLAYGGRGAAMSVDQGRTWRWLEVASGAWIQAATTYRGQWVLAVSEDLFDTGPRLIYSENGQQWNAVSQRDAVAIEAIIEHQGHAIAAGEDGVRLIIDSVALPEIVDVSLGHSGATGVDVEVEIEGDVTACQTLQFFGQEKLVYDPPDLAPLRPLHRHRIDPSQSRQSFSFDIKEAIPGLAPGDEFVYSIVMSCEGAVTTYPRFDATKDHTFSPVQLPGWVGWTLWGILGLQVLNLMIIGLAMRYRWARHVVLHPVGNKLISAVIGKYVITDALFHFVRPIRMALFRDYREGLSRSPGLDQWNTEDYYAPQVRFDRTDTDLADLDWTDVLDHVATQGRGVLWVVKGKSGLGKTALFENWCRHALEKGLTPVLVRLGSEHKPSEYAALQFNQYGHLPWHKADAAKVSSLMAQGRFVLLLDGLNEDNTSGQTSEFIQRMIGKNLVLMSTQFMPPGWDLDIPTRQIHLERFGERQLKQLMEGKWVDQVLSAEHLEEIAQLPESAKLLARYIKTHDVLPPSAVAIYDDLVGPLVGSPLFTNLEEEAWRLFRFRQIDFKASTELPADQICDPGVECGLLTRQVDGRYRFDHERPHHYLVARYWMRVDSAFEGTDVETEDPVDRIATVLNQRHAMLNSQQHPMYWEKVLEFTGAMLIGDARQKDYLNLVRAVAQFDPTLQLLKALNQQYLRHVRQGTVDSDSTFEKWVIGQLSA